LLKETTEAFDEVVHASELWLSLSNDQTQIKSCTLESYSTRARMFYTVFLVAVHD